MAAIAWADVVGAAPELVNRVAAGEQTFILAYVNNDAFEPAPFGGEDSATLERARVYLAAHMATMGLRTGAAGPVTSLTAGRETASFATFALKNTYYATGYGVLLEMILDTLPTRIGFTA